MSNMRHDEARSQRQAEAIQRQNERSLRSSQDQLNRLDKILGVGVGAKKERTRLQKQIIEDEQIKLQKTPLKGNE
jgi:hypothetical protein